MAKDPKKILGAQAAVHSEEARKRAAATAATPDDQDLPDNKSAIAMGLAAEAEENARKA